VFTDGRSLIAARGARRGGQYADRKFYSGFGPRRIWQFMLGQLAEPRAPDLVARAGLQPGRCVLDVASGLGPSPGSQPKPTTARRSLTATRRRTRTAAMRGIRNLGVHPLRLAERGDLHHPQYGYGNTRPYCIGVIIAQAFAQVRRTLNSRTSKLLGFRIERFLALPESATLPVSRRPAARRRWRSVGARFGLEGGQAAPPGHDPHRTPIQSGQALRSNEGRVLYTAVG
jgi:hypothetical protein